MEERLYNVARHYVWTIEQMERSKDPHVLEDLEEQRVIWHNKLMDIFRREGIPYHNRSHVTTLAYLLIRESE